MSCDLSDPAITVAYEEIINGQDTEWLILGYNDTRDKISLYSKGSHGLEGLRSNLKDEVLYGFIRIENKFVLLTYVSEQVRYDNLILLEQSFKTWFASLGCAKETIQTGRLTFE
ncbi:16625_t:CDS:2 [Entrophospora sp. SA101]|nr:16625_t:CDS:2 [Entrophospora sp. SA101]